jgi:hypothetical protein
VNRDLLIRWIEEALTAKTGEELHLPVETRKDRKALLKALQKEVEILRRIDPVPASTLVLSERTKDGQLYVIIKKVMMTPLVGFLKRQNGETERIEISHERDRWRRLKLMKDDGLSLVQIEEIEGDLTGEERLFIIGGKGND